MITNTFFLIRYQYSIADVDSKSVTQKENTEHGLEVRKIY